MLVTFITILQCCFVSQAHEPAAVDVPAAALESDERWWSETPRPSLMRRSVAVKPVKEFMVFDIGYEGDLNSEVQDMPDLMGPQLSSVRSPASKAVTAEAHSHGLAVPWSELQREHQELRHHEHQLKHARLQQQPHQQQQKSQSHQQQKSQPQHQKLSNEVQQKSRAQPHSEHEQLSQALDHLQPQPQQQTQEQAQPQQQVASKPEKRSQLAAHSQPPQHSQTQKHQKEPQHVQLHKHHSAHQHLQSQQHEQTGQHSQPKQQTVEQHLHLQKLQRPHHGSKTQQQKSDQQTQPQQMKHMEQHLQAGKEVHAKEADGKEAYEKEAEQPSELMQAEPQEAQEIYRRLWEEQTRPPHRHEAATPDVKRPHSSSLTQKSRRQGRGNVSLSANSVASTAASASKPHSSSLTQNSGRPGKANVSLSANSVASKAASASKSRASMETAASQTTSTTLTSNTPSTTTTTGGQLVDANLKIKTDSLIVAESQIFAEQVIQSEREQICPEFPSSVTIEVTAANTKVQEGVLVVLKAIMRADAVAEFPNQATEIARAGIEVEWALEADAATNDEQSALARTEQVLRESKSGADPLARAAKLVMPLAACSLMNKTFFQMCGRKSTTHADSSQASLSQQDQLEQQREELDEESSLRTLRQLYLSLPGGMGVIVDKELEAYRAGLRAQEEAAEKDPGSSPQSMMQVLDAGMLPSTFSWKAYSPHCLDYVHHQGTCGACFMFAALDSLADRHCIDQTNASSLGRVDHLSIQMGLLCEPLGRQCAGGWADVGFNYSVYYGIQPSSKWPYERSCLSDAECQFGKQCMSYSDYSCTNFFSQLQLDTITTFSDALEVTKTKCDNANLIDPDECKVWAETTFAMSPTMVFMPESCFCDEIAADFEKFARQTTSTSTTRQGSLIQAKEKKSKHLPRSNPSSTALVDLSTVTSFDFWDWLVSLFGGGRRRRGSESAAASPDDANGTSEDEDATDSKDAGKDRKDAGKDSEDAGTVDVVAQRDDDTTEAKDAACDRDRCLTEPMPHKSTRYHYITNTKDNFKIEIYNDGPFYTSYYVYEDFTWFFEYWPEHAYNYQWGSMQGGHAVALIGWEAECDYHGERIAIPTQGESVRQNTETSRRRQNKGECWHLRNTWGENWADKGFFRMVDDMLTGPYGYSLHIASAAGDGPHSS